jgi:hypothetical protein
VEVKKMDAPPEQVRSEIEAILRDDQSRIGDVYRRPDLTPEEIAADLGVSTHNFVFNVRYTIRALLEGVLPGGDAMRGQVAAKVRTYAKDRSLSAETRTYLEDLNVRLVGDSTPASGRSSPRQPGLAAPRATRTTLRREVEEEIRHRARDLVQQIKETTGIDPVDYWGVTTSSSPLDVVVRLVRTAGEEGTFQKLAQLRRLDLSLEAAVLTWAEDLPMQRNLVEDAEAKKAWFS